MRVVLTILFALLWLAADACSSAIVARKLSKEGEVMLWKHRDQTDINDCRIAHFDDGKYAYTALVNSYVRVGESVLAGVNEVGFGCINTATRNLSRKPTKQGRRYSGKYSLSCRALRECATVDEFEQMLKRNVRSADFQTNIGVGDATGAAAYFEIWSDGYARYDVDTYDVRTNFSFAGRDDERGTSVRRYDTVRAQMEGKRSFAPADFFGYSRSFFSAEVGDVLASDKPFREANYIVPRPSSVASVVIVCSDNPRIEAIVGHPVAGISVPVWVAAKRNIPECVGGRAMYDLGRLYASKAYYKQGRAIFLNKAVAAKVVKIENHIKTPKSMPQDIAKFNTKIDRIFEKHRQKIVDVLH